MLYRVDLARPVADLPVCSAELRNDVGGEAAHRLLGQLEIIKENIRNAIQSANEETQKKEPRYG